MKLELSGKNNGHSNNSSHYSVCMHFAENWSCFSGAHYSHVLTIEKGKQVP